MANEKLNITALSPGDLATLFSRSLKRPVTEQQVRDIAEAGNLLNENDTINLIEYSAYLAGKVNYANTN
ncbi:MAG: hypothetical protein FWH27_17710 [Planctomycetaceae bacterium]|nr:hypothetical protein [Planctomycetaceae bacterium]